MNDESSPPVKRCERYYRIGKGEADRFVLRTLFVEGRACETHIGRRCYEALEGRETPCLGCPVLALEENVTTRCSVIDDEVSGGARLVTARASAEGDTEIRVRCIEENELFALLESRLRRMARDALLSPQETKVLDLLLIGRRPREVALALDISERTVKFHQTNALEKLGADSRLDLLRLVLRPSG